ncbi:unnamed protein product [Ectocarpus sp. 13 AM-2016]
MFHGQTRTRDARNPPLRPNGRLVIPVLGALSNPGGMGSDAMMAVSRNRRKVRAIVAPRTQFMQYKTQTHARIKQQGCIDAHSSLQPPTPFSDLALSTGVLLRDNPH